MITIDVVNHRQLLSLGGRGTSGNSKATNQKQGQAGADWKGKWGVRMQLVPTRKVHPTHHEGKQVL